MKKSAMNVPNMLSMLRVALVPAFVAAMIFMRDIPVWGQIIPAVIYALTALTDMLDGKIARKYNLVTDFGKFIDPLADKFMVIGMLVVMCASDMYASVRAVLVWVTLVVILRELAVTSLRLLVASSEQKIVVAASWLGKIKTVLQVVCIVTVLVEPALAKLVPVFETNILSYVTMIAMLVMTLMYVTLVAIFIAGAYVITDGMGWDFVGAIFIAIFSVPFFVTVLSVVLLISMRHLKVDKALPNQSFDVVIVRVAVLMMLLAAISGILFILSDTRVIRSALLTDITSNGIAYFSMLGIVAFLNKPLAFLSYKIVKAVSRNKDLEYVTNRPAIIIRTILLVIGVILATVPFIVSLI